MNYNSKLSLLETQKAITMIKDTFKNCLLSKLNLTPISTPILVETNSGLYSLFAPYGVVTLELKPDVSATLLTSLDKWKRTALKPYGFEVGEGLYSTQRPLRRYETPGQFHSYTADQWHWEKVINLQDRNIAFLKSIVRDIYECLKTTEQRVLEKYPTWDKKLPEEIAFISTQQMEDEYPELSSKERESKYTERHGAVFVMQVGKSLQSGSKHEYRDPDCDDWELNGDILVHYAETALELSSMGIRVSKESLLSQLEEEGALDKTSLPYHKSLLEGELPYSIGGGIGQSRVCMFLLDKEHIGEIQVSVWDEKTKEDCAKRNIKLL